MEVISKTEPRWVGSRRAVIYWVLISGVVLSVLLNAVTGIGAAISDLVQENALVDKVAHCFFFGAISFLIHRGLRLQLTCSTWIVVAVSLAVSGTLGLLDEYSQLWITGRNFDYSDLVANFVGLALIGPWGCLTLESAVRRGEKGEGDGEHSPIVPKRTTRTSAFVSSMSNPSRRRVLPTGHRRRSRAPIRHGG